MPEVDEAIDFRRDEQKWQKLMALRDEVLRELEGLRRNREIASNQEASVRIRTTDEELLKILQNFGEKNFASLCIVSEIKFEKPTDTLFYLLK
jgi:isoleucyl-tRNA synthetase